VGSTRNQQEYQTFYDGRGGWRWAGMGEPTTPVENYPLAPWFCTSIDKMLEHFPPHEKG